MDYGAIDLGKGGSAIPYHQEDGRSAASSKRALDREGMASRMEERFYEPSSDPGEEPAQLM